MSRLSAGTAEIGVTLKRSHGILVASVLCAVAIVAIDLALARRYSLQHWRWVLIVVSLAVIGSLARWDRGSLGLRLSPVQGYKYWLKAALILGSIVGGFVVMVWAAAFLFRFSLPDCRLFGSSREYFPWLWGALVVAPLSEEAIYRFTVCTPAVAAIGKAGTIVLGGCLFSLLHFIYGNPYPDNFIAGFVLTWAYLHSGTVLIPIMLHALGNLAVFIFHVGILYLDV